MLSAEGEDNINKSPIYVMFSVNCTPLFSKQQAHTLPYILGIDRPNMESMDQGAKSSILKGCKLAGDLELRLESLVNRPDTVASACEEIARAFHGAMGGLARTCSLGGEAGQEECCGGRGIRSYECLATGPNTAVRSVQAEIGGRIIGVAVPSDSSRVSPSSSLGEPSRREGAAKQVMRVPVPEIGNPELPPDDGHTWRKYGQKKILNCNFPRGYYRCTHQKSYRCPAKRTVQRLDADPSTFEVTYINHHTCHLSSTAPSSVPPPPPGLLPPGCMAGRLITAATASSGGGWPAPLSLGSGDGEAKYAVAQMADAMFNGRGTESSSSIMDLIFTADAKDD